MKKWNVRSKKLIYAFALLISGAIGAGETYSYFMEKEEVINVFTVGDFDISLKEPEWDPKDGDGVNLYPGYTVYKNPTVKNRSDASGGAQPCYVQMRMEIQDEKGKNITDPEVLEMIRRVIRYDETYNGSWKETGEGEKLRQGRIPGYSMEEIEALPMINPDFYETDTEKEGEYLFRYLGKKKGILDIEDEAVLFTDIVIPTQWGEEEMQKIGKFQIQVTAEAIQANGFISEKDAFHALGESLEKGALHEDD